MNDASSGRTIVIDRSIPLADAFDIAEGRLTIVLSKAALARCSASFARLDRIVEENRHVYGVTTGFGPLANRLVDARHGALLQQNLVHHLASGVGPAFSWDAGRAITLARIMSLVQGASGAHPETLQRLVAVLNAGLSPVIPSQGTVGASGDLTPLAHLVLCLQGRGEFTTRDGQTLSGDEALRLLGTTPLDLSHRDGLALVNGTSAMTGIAVLNAIRLERALNWSVALSGGFAESLAGRAEAWHDAFAELRPHPGQVLATKLLNRCIAGSQRMQKSPLAANCLGDGSDIEDAERAGQDAYTIRCAPQVIGAVWDTAMWHRRIVEVELSAVTDNPILPVAGEVPALHGGNFMGGHVALASDAVANAATVLAGLVERQIARVTDERLNGGLPAFLSGGRVGLTSGFMGAQVTATALLAEMRATGATSVQSISTNGANQDVVSMGTIAARNVENKLQLLARIQAISALCVAQAVDLCGHSGFSESCLSTHRFVRDVSAYLEDDRPLGPEIEGMASRMRDTDPLITA